MDLTNFSSKLEPCLLIAKSAKGAAAARLAEDATTAPGVFVFSELLELPNIQEVCFFEWISAEERYII
jgi:COP9 signalosome complex subunit 7